MKLYLCEKPSQAKDIAPHIGARIRGDGVMTGDGVAVTWAIGHLVELAKPEHYNAALTSWDINLLPVVPEAWHLEVKAATKTQYKVIVALLKNATEVVIATDADREGEVIARELMQLAGYRGKVSRLWLSAMDEASIKKALGRLLPDAKTLPLYFSGLGRARADWLAGMNMTMALTKAFGQGGKGGVLHCGRVQTPVLALIVRRERAIRNFVTVTHYGLKARFLMQGVDLPLTWEPDAAIVDQAGLVIQRESAEKARTRVEKKRGSVTEVETTPEQELAPLLYSLGELQKEASRRFGMKAQAVLTIAQSLYETHKATTYPRTDCQYLPSSMLAEAGLVLNQVATSNPGLSAHCQTAIIAANTQGFKNRVFNDKQITAHHAIIPTMNPNVKLSAMSADEARIYDMVCRRYVALFLGAHRFDKTVVHVECGGEKFRTSGKAVTSPGWKVLYPASKDSSAGKPGKSSDEDHESESINLPVLSVGNDAINLSCEVVTKATKPPKRYTEGTLIEAMESIDKEIDDPRMKQIMKNKEKAGIGTDATHSSIIENLFKRDYLQAQGKELVPSGRAIEFIELLEKIAPELADPVLTAQWEEQLTQIEHGELRLEQFEGNLAKWLKQLTSSIRDQKGSFTVGGSAGQGRSASQVKASGKAAAKPNDAANNDRPCPKCSKPLKLRTGARGAFWGCTGYPECKHTQPDNEGKPVQKSPEPEKPGHASVQEKVVKPKAKAGQKCPNCEKGELIGRVFKENNKAYVGCNQFPVCRFFAWPETSLSVK